VLFTSELVKLVEPEAIDYYTASNFVCGFLCQPCDTCLRHSAASHKAL